MGRHAARSGAEHQPQRHAPPFGLHSAKLQPAWLQPEQQLLLAALVRFHRKAIKLEELPRLNLFKKKHYLPLIQLLRLSTLLNNQRQSTTTPETLRLTTDDNHWTLRFPAGYLAQNNLVQLDFEREQAYWNDVVGWKLLIDEEGSQDEQRSA